LIIAHARRVEACSSITFRFSGLKRAQRCASRKLCQTTQSLAIVTRLSLRMPFDRSGSASAYAMTVSGKAQPCARLRPRRRRGERIRGLCGSGLQAHCNTRTRGGECARFFDRRTYQRHGRVDHHADHAPADERKRPHAGCRPFPGQPLRLLRRTAIRQRSGTAAS
jgi:hypothetical protein